jgi:hypothetical protein
MQHWTRQKWLESGTPEQRKEWAKQLPLAWLLEYQPTILLPGKGQAIFEPWYFQQEFMNCRDRFRIINKPRQCGISTTAAAEVAWEFDNVPGAQIVIISKDKDAAENFHRYVYNILKSVRINNPKSPALTKTNQRVTENELGSKISSLASSKESGRSFSATHLIFDELAFIEYAEDIWQAANATLSQTRGRVTAISTPKGRANLFARIFEETDHMGFTVFSYGWWDVPTYNPYYDEYMRAETAAEKKLWIQKARGGEWYRSERPKYTDLAWRQEFEGAFDANAGSVFSTRQLEKVFCRNYLREKEDPTGGITEWWTMEKAQNAIYVHGIDLGRKNDPTVIVTYNVKTRPAEMVDFKYIEAGRCEWDEILRICREHIEFWDSEGEHDGTGVGDSISDGLQGFSEPFMFTKNLKQNMIELMQHAFDYKMVRIPKIPLLFREHQRYIWDDKDIQQDTVMANALAIKQFHETEDVFSGYADLNFVGSVQ